MPSNVWRLVDSGLVPPADSAAIDEAVLESHVAGEVPDTLHFYRRRTPTISLGYFQRVGESVNLPECERRGVSLVRRKSGGSSIYTDPGQLIYGLVLHEKELPTDRTDSFCAVCSALADAIRSFGVDAKFRPLNDVEVGGRKISGNAQLRRRGSVLQHGTILVDADLDAMDSVLKVVRSKREDVTKPSDRVTTMRSLLGVAPQMEVVKQRVVDAISAKFKVAFEKEGLSDHEESTVRSLVDDCYGRKEWNFKF
jgi:lipoate-protein ligase A